MRIGSVRVPVACLVIALACWHTSAEADGDDDGSLTPYYSPTPRSPSPAPPAPPVSPGLPRAMCKGRDFADLVNEECRPKPGAKEEPDEGKPDPPALPPVGPSPGAPSFEVTVTPAPPKDVPEFDFDACEERVTIQELQRNIIQEKDVQCVAQILIQTGSVTGIEGGFRIDPDFNFQPNCGQRQFDPDVVALKGIALGILERSEADGGLIRKIADGVVPSFTPTGEKVPKDMLDPGAFLEVLRNLRTLRTAFDEDANTTPPCKIKPPHPKKTGPHRPYYQSPPQSHHKATSHWGSHWESHSSGRRLLDYFPGAMRNLQCADCDNADSFPCAYCWQQDVCGDLYWCQDP